VPSLSGAGSTGDMFLSVKGQKSGVIKGESQDPKHANEIDVVSWSWGMQGKPTFGGGSVATGKAIIHELKIVKHIDCASTALMAALRTNELIKQAVLVIRKAGSKPLEYLKITIENGRVTSLNLDAGEGPAGPQIVENVSFTFNKITVEYIQQLKDGQGGPGFMFADQWDEPNKYGDVET
jgi:type VI secretion system secreted protein Hcp